MNEERRVKAKEGQNRFTYEYISASAKVNDVEEKVIFKQLFDEAKAKYPEIYTNEDEKLNITDNACIITLIKSLAPFSFIGTGDDIKGAVYEIFLKSTLRGEFDQFFTPREIVDFIVRFADPNVGDVILDPSCGSGGFLIQAFTYVNAKINSAGYSEIENNNKFQALIDKCLWGQEADYDLHVLAKINLIMHGDGYNNIYQGDTLKSRNIPDNYFDYVLANPPFTTPYEFKDVLSNYELGIGKESEELDILFVEKSIRALKPNGDLYIVLPEGLLNNRRYLYFRKWILKKTDLLMSVSLPEGAFIPFGGSVSKTCIIGLRKKGDDGNYIRPEYVFLGAVNEIGYECGKKGYRQHNQNDLLEFNNLMNEIFSGLKCTTNGGTCGWIKQDEISDYRMDANFLLNKIDRVRLEKKFDKMIPLSEVCTIDNKSVNIYKDNIYNYLEVLDISPVTGTITNIRKRYGYEIGDSFNKFEKGDILFTRINPRISRVAIAPQIDDFGVVSKEVYRLVYKENKYIKKENFYVICAILRNEDIVQQIVRLSTGSSSSRARVQKEDLLNEVFIPVIDEKVQKSISNSTYNTSVMIWKQAQAYLKTYEKNQKLLGSNVSMNELRSI